MIESKLDPGRGPVVTVLVQRGTLQVGDALVAGAHWGRVRAMHDFIGERVNEARARRAGRGARLRRRPRRRRVRARRRERPQAPASSPASARRGSRPRRSRAAPGAKVSLEDVFTRRPGGRGQGAQPRAQGRRVRLARGARGRDREAAARSEVAVNVIHTRRRRHQRVRRHARRRLGGRRSSASTCARSATRARPPTARASRSAPTRSSTRRLDELRAAMEGMLEPEEVEDVARPGRGPRRPSAPRGSARSPAPTSPRARSRAAPKVRLVRDGTVVYDGDDRLAAALQGRRARGRRGLRVRHRARELPGRQGRRRPRGLRDAQGRARARVSPSPRAMPARRAPARPPALPGRAEPQGQAQGAASVKAQLHGRLGLAVAEVEPPGPLAAGDARRRRSRRARAGARERRRRRRALSATRVSAGCSRRADDASLRRGRRG